MSGFEGVECQDLNDCEAGGLTTSSVVSSQLAPHQARCRACWLSVHNQSIDRVRFPGTQAATEGSIPTP